MESQKINESKEKCKDINKEEKKVTDNCITEEGSKTKESSGDSQKSKNKNVIQLKEELQNLNKIVISNISLDESTPAPDDQLFEEIKQKLNNTIDYTQEELIKDMNNIISKNAFIKEFKGDNILIKKENFEIFNDIKESQIYMGLNLLNYTNLINWINNFTINHPTQLPIILKKKLSINFSWIESDKKDEAILTLQTPKSPVLYNYLSTNGSTGIQNKKYKKLVNNFCSFEDKFKFDYGYCYEDLTVYHILESIGEDNCEVFPNIMYYVKKDMCDKLKELDLI